MDDDVIENTPQPVRDDMAAKYHTYAQLFVDKHDFDVFDAEVHWEKIQEEIEELGEEVDQFVDGNGDLNQLEEELADALHALFVLGQMFDSVDVWSAFEAKAEYNLQKSTETDERGFVTDDA